MKTLDLGCGPNPKNPFEVPEVFGVDVVNFDNPNILTADLAVDKIPFEDNSFDYVTGYDFLEHIPRVLYIDGKRKQPFIDIMSEVWRVLKPGGEAYFVTPAYPKKEAFSDPQHVNIITDDSIRYFCSFVGPGEWTGLELAKSYGFTGNFIMLDHRWREDVPYHLIWHIKAVK